MNYTCSRLSINFTRNFLKVSHIIDYAQLKKISCESNILRDNHVNS